MKGGFFITLLLTYSTVQDYFWRETFQIILCKNKRPSWEAVYLNAHSSVEFWVPEAVKDFILMKLIILGLRAAEQVIYFRMYEHQKLKELKKFKQLKQYVWQITDESFHKRDGWEGGEEYKSNKVPSVCFIGCRWPFTVQSKRK